MVPSTSAPVLVSKYFSKVAVSGDVGDAARCAVILPPATQVKLSLTSVVPCLVGEERQVVPQVLPLHPNRIEDVSQVVFGVCDHKGGVTNVVGPVGAHHGFLRGRE